MYSKKLLHITKKYSLCVEILIDYSEICNVVTQKEVFESLCLTGCQNYGKKYSCPPYSKKFEVVAKDYNNFLVIAAKIEMKQFDSSYISIKAANSILRSIEKKTREALAIMIKARGDLFSFLSNGACRRCKRCACNDQLCCRYKNDMYYSLEATGVDVNSLVNNLFGVTLQWYKNKLLPKYQVVVGAILHNGEKIEYQNCSVFKQNTI